MSGAPLIILGVGLTAKSRQPESNISYTAMCQIFVGLGWHSCYLLADDYYGCLRLENYTRYPGYRGSGYHHWQRLWEYCCCRHVDWYFFVKLLALPPTSTPAGFTSIYGSLFVQQFYAREQQPVMLSTMYMVTHNVSCSLLQPAFILSHEHLVSSRRVLNVKKMKQQVHGIHRAHLFVM